MPAKKQPKETKATAADAAKPRSSKASAERRAKDSSVEKRIQEIQRQLFTPKGARSSGDDTTGGGSSARRRGRSMTPAETRAAVLAVRSVRQLAADVQGAVAAGKQKVHVAVSLPDASAEKITKELLATITSPSKTELVRLQCGQTGVINFNPTQLAMGSAPGQQKQQQPGKQAGALPHLAKPAEEVVKRAQQCVAVAATKADNECGGMLLEVYVVKSWDVSGHVILAREGPDGFPETADGVCIATLARNASFPGLRTGDTARVLLNRSFFAWKEGASSLEIVRRGPASPEFAARWAGFAGCDAQRFLKTCDSVGMPNVPRHFLAFQEAELPLTYFSGAKGQWSWLLRGTVADCSATPIDVFVKEAAMPDAVVRAGGRFSTVDVAGVVIHLREYLGVRAVAKNFGLKSTVTVNAATAAPAAAFGSGFGPRGGGGSARASDGSFGGFF